MIQVEINENLRRKSDELRTKIEALGEPEAGDATAGEDLETHTRQLQALNANIDSTTKRIRGTPFSPSLFTLVILTRPRQIPRKRSTR